MVMAEDASSATLFHRQAQSAQVQQLDRAVATPLGESNCALRAQGHRCHGSEVC